MFPLDGENESHHLTSSINLAIDALIDGRVIQLIEHLYCGLSLFRLLECTAQQLAGGPAQREPTQVNLLFVPTFGFISSRKTSLEERTKSYIICTSEKSG